MILRNINSHDGNLAHAVSRGMHDAMAPGPNLDQMTRRVLTVMGPFFDELGEQGEQTVNLYEWIRPRFTKASTEAIYGPGNPFKYDPDLEEAFW